MKEIKNDTFKNLEISTKKSLNIRTNTNNSYLNYNFITIVYKNCQLKKQ